MGLNVSALIKFDKYILIFMQEGRRYRGDEIYVKDWSTFLKVQKSYDFIKGFNGLTPEKYTEQTRNKFIELLQDEKYQCFVFPNSLKPEYLEMMINLVKSDSFKMLLDYEHESLYMDNPKQLVVFRKRASISAYLSKYRLTKEYQKLFTDGLQVGKEFQALVAERNVKISQQLSEEEIEEVTAKIMLFRKQKLDPKLEAWRKYTIRMVKDFVSQQKKQQMIFLGINSIMTEELKTICKDHELYFSNRFQKVSDQDEYRDVCFTKLDQSQPSCSFDDKSIQSDEEMGLQQLSQKLPMEEEKLVIQVPKNVEHVSFQGYASNGANCIVSIPTFGKLNPVDYLRIRLISPRQTDHQKNYEQKILVSQGQYQCFVVLHCLHHGCSTFEISSVNSVGVSKKPYIFKIWMETIPDSANTEGLLKINNNNYSLYMLGQNDQGVIPNWDQQSTNIIMTTDQKWEMLKFACAQFSVSSQGTICNRQGDVASWGKMYYYDEEGLNQQESKSSDQDEDDQLGLTKMESQHYRIEKPCSILESSWIRKVSCGEGYCLMADSLGRAWSFGINTFGQLGLEHLNESADTSEPAIIKYFSYEKIFVTDVVGSYYGASFAIDDRGQAYRWGTNQIQSSPNPIKDSYNNIINFEYPDIVAAQSLPIPISKKLISQKIRSIHPGIQFVMALTEQNKVYGWGRIKYFGVGNMQDAHFNSIQNVCNPIPIHQNIKKISVGLSHCVALKLDGSLIGWGDNKCYENEKSKEFSKKAHVIRENYQWQFICGPDFTVFQEQGNNIRVIGKQSIFRQKVYKLPCKPLKIEAGQGVIVVMSSSIPQAPKSEDKSVSEIQPEPVKIQAK